jgi:DNA-binding NtrC family response regulator
VAWRLLRPWKKINPETVGIVMTAYRHEMNALVEEALDHWAYASLHKSLDIESLLKLLDEICERRQKAGWL